MKSIKNIKRLGLIAAIGAVSLTGCKTDFDINTSEENLSAASLNYRDVLPSAMANSAKIVAADWKFLQNWMGYWARSGSYQNNTEEETYVFTNTFPTDGGNNPWNDLYYNASSYQYVFNKAKASGDGFYEAICRIMKSHNFQILTDVYGNIPYTQALQGNDLRNPKYDKGVDIYNDIFRQLDTAIAILKDDSRIDPVKNAKISSNDLMFHGDADMWIKFANTLKLRMLVHCKGGGVESDAPEYTVQGIDVAEEMTIINQEGSGFLGAGETASINPGYSASKPNPFYRNFALNENGVLAGQADFTKANAFAVGTGANNNPGYYQFDYDPRVDKLYVKPDNNSDAAVYEAKPFHKGIPYGAISGQFASSTGVDLSAINAINPTSPNTGLTPDGPASDAWIITSVESLFLQAEAASRGIMTGDPKQLLNDAINESFVFLGLTADDAQQYLTDNGPSQDYPTGFPDVIYTADPLGPGLPGGGLYTILSQKWFALNAIAPYEVWTDYRRTDIKIGAGVGFDQSYKSYATIKTILSGAHLDVPGESDIPVRLFYPQSEYSFNEANVQSQGTINVFGNASNPNNKIFWDNFIR
jgi:hypothetical protein